MFLCVSLVISACLVNLSYPVSKGNRVGQGICTAFIVHHSTIHQSTAQFIIHHCLPCLIIDVAFIVERPFPLPIVAGPGKYFLCLFSFHSRSSEAKSNSTLNRTACRNDFPAPSCKSSRSFLTGLFSLCYLDGC